MNDDRISRYLQHQAEGIALSPADPAGAMRRGNRRRARRRAGLVGSVAVLGVVATSIAVYDGGDDQQVRSVLGATASASTYEWSTVTPQTGLGYGGHTAQLADGTVYSISTAPGPYRDDRGDEQLDSTLYRSADGAEWSAASLPSGVRVSDLAGTGDTLYSVGTSPAGGVVLSASTDGAASWSSLDLPDDVTAVHDRHPDQIILGPARVAALDGTRLVASIIASTNLDLSQYKPEYSPDRYSAVWGDDGVQVFENPVETCSMPDPAGGSDPNAVDAAIGCRAEAEATGKDRGAPVASFTYDELGIVGELRDHVGGKPYVFATDDGETFRRAELPGSLSQSAGDGWLATPVATADGFRLVLAGGSSLPGSDEANPVATVLRSADGFTWDVSATLPGSAGDIGVLNGRAAATTWGADGESTLRTEQADGTWATLDLAGAVTAPEHGWTSVESVTFGPLGFAAVVGTSSEDGPYVQHLVHSTDGATLQVLRVADVVDSGGMVSGLVVTPDAIVARVIAPNDRNDATPPTQEVLVGTPAG